jgi:hypothetical protein
VPGSGTSHRHDAADLALAAVGGEEEAVEEAIAVLVVQGQLDALGIGPLERGGNLQWRPAAAEQDLGHQLPLLLAEAARDEEDSHGLRRLHEQGARLDGGRRGLAMADVVGGTQRNSAGSRLPHRQIHPQSLDHVRREIDRTSVSFLAEILVLSTDPLPLSAFAFC